MDVWWFRLNKEKTKMIDWDDTFKNAHLHSWPTATVSVSNVCPKGDGARNIYQEDKKQIHAAAAKYGYEVCFTGSRVCFINHNKRGLLFTEETNDEEIK